MRNHSKKKRYEEVKVVLFLTTFRDVITTSDGVYGFDESGDNLGSWGNNWDENW